MMYFKSLINGLDELPARDDDYRLELEEIKRRDGAETLFRMLKKIDPKYA